MANEIRAATVADLQAEGVLLVEDGNHGEYRPRPSEFVSSGCAFIRAADMDDGVVRFDSASKITERARARITKGIGAPGDVLLSHKGTVGKVAYVPADAPEFVCSPQTTFWRTLDSGRLDRWYLFAFLRSASFRAQLLTRSGETDMAPYVSLTSQRGLTVILPSIEEQRRIGDIFRSLDEKLALNRNLQRSLLRIVRAIFSSWFVDFEPVRDNAEGRKTKLDFSIANLFPSGFEQSQRGPVPMGWHWKAVREELNLAYGKALPDSDRRRGSIPVYGSNGQIGWHDSKLADGPGIVIGRKGNPGIVTYCPTDFFCIDTTFYAQPKRDLGAVTYWWIALDNLNLASFAADSAVPGLNRDVAYGLDVLVPSNDIVRAFNLIAQPFVARWRHCGENSAEVDKAICLLLARMFSDTSSDEEAVSPSLARGR